MDNPLDEDKNLEEAPLAPNVRNSLVNEDTHDQQLEESAAAGTGKDLRDSMGAKFLVLFFSCNFVVGSYYCYDIPGTLNT